MSAAKKKGRGKSDEPERRGRGFMSRLRSLIYTPLTILAILYVGLLIGARTEGFRYTLAERQSEKLGLFLAFGGSRMTPGLELVLEDVKGGSGVDVPGEAGFTAEEIHLKLSPWFLFRSGAKRVESIALVRPRFHVLTGEEGDEPALAADFLASFLAVINLDDSARTHGALEPAAYSDMRVDRPIVRCSITDGEWLWVSGDGQVIRRLMHADLLQDRVELPGRTFEYVRIRSANGEVGDAVYDHLHAEWLTGGGRLLPLQFSIQWREPAARADRSPAPSQPRAAVQHYLQRPSPAASSPP